MGQLIRVNIGKEMVYIVIEYVYIFNLAFFCLRRLKRALHNQLFDILEACIAADRAGLPANQLHSVIFLRIMARGNHNPAVKLQMSCGEINHFRSALSDIHNVTAGISQSVNKCLGNRRSRKTDVMSHSYLFRVKKLYKGTAYTVSQLLIDLLGINPAYIVCSKPFAAQNHTFHSSHHDSMTSVCDYTGEKTKVPIPLE